VTGRRRGVRLRHTRWGTATWFLASRLAIAVSALGALALRRSWHALAEECVVHDPVPGVTADCPDGAELIPGDDGGKGEDGAFRSTSVMELPREAR